VALAARREQALSIGDALLRRTRLGLLPRAAGRLSRRVSPAADGPVARVADVLAGELGWDVARRTPSSRRLRASERRGDRPLLTPAAAPTAHLVPPARRGAHARAGPASILMGIVTRRPTPSATTAGAARSRIAFGSRSSCGPTVPRSSTLGGESATTGRSPVDVALEVERVGALVERVASFAIVSVDTYKPDVAPRAIAAGRRARQTTSAGRGVCGAAARHRC